MTYERERGRRERGGQRQRLLAGPRSTKELKTAIKQRINHKNFSFFLYISILHNTHAKTQLKKRKRTNLFLNYLGNQEKEAHQGDPFQ
uniref:Uncharacterized protein n=1 Tax=Rhizophora mucronata TaxID=61149 RepID=A0A2P2KGF6_RHIMU